MPTITAGAGPGGVIAPSGAVPVMLGEDQNFTITPARGFRVLSVLADAVDLGLVLAHTFVNVTADHTITATFQQIDYVNEIADQLVTLLRTINGPAGGYTVDFTGARVERSHSEPDWTQLPRPWVGVRLLGATEIVPLSTGVYRMVCKYGIGFLIDVSGYSLTESPRVVAERAGAIYAQDIMRALASDVNLSAVLTTGIINPASFEVRSDPNIGAMVALGSLVAEATWIWRA